MVISGNHRTLIVEVDGYKGHNSKYQHNRDIRRRKDIQRAHGKFIEFYRFTIWELLVLTDDEIFEELGF